MTAHQAWVFYTGAILLVVALILFGGCKALGPTYADRITVGWKIRGSIFLLAVMSLIRGITLIFPGREVHVEFIPWIVPVHATALALAVWFSVDWVVTHRAPPPMLNRLGGAMKIIGAARPRHTNAVDQLLASAGIADETPAISSRRFRHAIIASCALGLLVLLMIVYQAAAQEAPHF